jgi:serine/threonine protein kinase
MCRVSAASSSGRKRRVSAEDLQKSIEDLQKSIEAFKLKMMDHQPTSSTAALSSCGSSSSSPPPPSPQPQQPQRKAATSTKESRPLQQVTNSQLYLYPILGRPTNILNDYIVFPAVLGTGHYGTVRECMHRQTRRPHAVKSIEKAKLQRLDHLRREVDLLASVRHSSVMRMVNCYEDANYVHIVTEKYCGGELFDRILEHTTDDGCFDEQSAARIIKSLLEAVAYLHDHGIVHRDIKPENILFESQEHDSPIRLIDFGLARRHDSGLEACMSNPVGTAYYMSPELLKCNFSAPTDIWSTGIIAYILLCGYPPFNGDTDREIFDAISRGHFDFPSESGWMDKSPLCMDFIKCLLRRDPRKRFTAHEALMHPWIVCRCRRGEPTN